MSSASSSSSSSSALLSSSAAVAPLPPPMTASAILKASAAATARLQQPAHALDTRHSHASQHHSSTNTNTTGATHQQPHLASPISSPAISATQQPAGLFTLPIADSAAPSSSSSSSSVDRSSRLRRLLQLCESSAAASAGLSLGEVLNPLAYVCRPLTTEESRALHRIVDPELTDDSQSPLLPTASATAVPTLSMRTFQLALQDCIDREEASGRGEGGADVVGAEVGDVGDADASFVSAVLGRLRVRVGEERSSAALQERVGLDAAASEVARARTQLRNAEEAGRALTERVERLTLHCRRVEEDNARLLQATATVRREVQSEAQTSESLQSALAQQQSVVGRLQSTLQHSQTSLATSKAEQQHSLALLQMERSAKKALSQELLQLKAQVSALQAERSTEMRAVLKRKKEEMAAIMDSHRYTKQLKRQAERVQPLEVDLAQAKALIAKQADDIAEYQRLLDEWRGGGGRSWMDAGAAAAATRPRAGFSLCDDLDLDEGAGGPSASASRGHSRRVSQSGPAVQGQALQQRAMRRSSGELVELVEQVAAFQVERLQLQQSATELRGHRDALLLSLSSAEHDREELDGRLHAKVAQWEELQRELTMREQLVQRVQKEGEEQREALEAEEERRLRLLQEDWQLQRGGLEGQVRQLQGRLGEAEATSARLRLSVDSGAAELSAARMRAEAAEAARLCLLHSTADSAKAQLQQLRAERQAAQAEVQALTSTRATLTAALAETEAQLRRLQLLYAQGTDELERLRRMQSEWESEREELLHRIAELQRRVDSHVCPSPQPTSAGDSAVFVSTAALSCPQALRLLEGEAEVPSASSLEEVSALSSTPLWPSIRLSEEQQLEVDCYSRYANLHLRDDASLSHLLPIQEGSSELLAKVRDGLLLSALLNHAVPDLIDVRALNRRSANATSLGWQGVVQNLNLVINAAKAVGIAMTLTNPHSHSHTHTSTASTTSTTTSTTASTHIPLLVVDGVDEADQSSRPFSSSTSSASRAASASVVVLSRSSTRSASALSAESAPPPYMARIRRSSSSSSSSAASDESESVELRSPSAVDSDNDGPGAVSPSPSTPTPAAGLSSSSALDLGSTQLQLMESSEPSLVLDFIHRIIRLAVMREVDVRRHPRIRILCTAQPSCTEQALQLMTQEQLLARWTHFTLAQHHQHTLSALPLTTTTNLVEGLRSGAGYRTLLQQLLPQQQAEEGTGEAMGVTQGSAADAAMSELHRALARLTTTEVPHFHTVAALQRGPVRLHWLLLACIFAHCDGLPHQTAAAPSVFSSAALTSSTSTGSIDDEAEGSRLEVSFRHWINSAGISGMSHVQSLFGGDCSDGLLLLRLIDWVERGSVDWKAVELHPTNKFKAVSNCNLAIRLCKEKLRASLVGIGGEDIYDGSQKLILAVIWQLMRYNAIKKLDLIRLHNSHTNHRTAAGGATAAPAVKKLTDADILAWANAAVAAHPHPVAARTTSLSLRSWRDPSCTTSIFLLNLLHTLDTAVVDWQQVHTEEERPAAVSTAVTAPAAATPSAVVAAASSSAADPTLGLSVSSRLSNALYAISIARKLGAETFLMPEDIVECKAKMILLLVGSCMALQQEQEQQHSHHYR